MDSGPVWRQVPVCALRFSGWGSARFRFLTLARRVCRTSALTPPRIPVCRNDWERKKHLKTQVLG